MRTIVLFNNYSFAFSIILQSETDKAGVAVDDITHILCISCVPFSWLCCKKKRRKVFRFKIMENFPIEFYYFIPFFNNISTVTILYYVHFLYQCSSITSFIAFLIQSPSALLSFSIFVLRYTETAICSPLT